jgi:hypothetical protein
MAQVTHTFKEYLLRNQRTYDFKIKIAGDCPEDCTTLIKEALVQYSPASCEQGLRTPIQEQQMDFPDLKNLSATTFEVSVNYPVTSTQVRTLVAERLNTSTSFIKVRTPFEESALENNLPSEENGQALVGNKRAAELQKALKKEPRFSTQVKGTNDKLLAKKSPRDAN